MNRIRSLERHNGQLASVLLDARGFIFIGYLEKGHQQVVLHGVIGAFLNDEIKKKMAPFDEKKCCFIKKMHCVTYQSKRRQNCMN
jgi:hypothetical protein